MRRLIASLKYTASAYDPLSIMHYSLPARYFLRRQNSPCFISPNYDFSDGDKKGMAKAYPARPLFLSEELDVLNKQLQSVDVTDTTRRAFIQALERADPGKAGQKLSEE
jgi:hypothetical protein